MQYGNPVEYGVIKWIGHLPNEEGLYAGVEMVRHFVSVCMQFVLSGFVLKQYT